MWVIIVLGLLVLAVLTVFGMSFFALEDEGRTFARLAAGALAVVTLVFAVLCSITQVSTRNVGVITTFGRPVGTLSNGLHVVWPWQSVTEMDGAVQIDWHRDEDPNGDQHGNALVVRLANNSNAWTDTSVRWEIKLEAADDLFLQYKTFDNVRSNLVTRNLQTALNEVFAGYNPLATINPANPGRPVNADDVTKSRLPELAAQATTLLQQKVGDQVRIFEVQIPTIAFDGRTQGLIDDLNGERAKTATAIQAQATADAQAIANSKLAASVNNDPNVLVSKCLDVVKEKGGSVLGCWPGALGAVPTVPVR